MTSTEPSHSLWFVDQLKINVTGYAASSQWLKEQAGNRFTDFQKVEVPQAELGAVACSRTSVYQQH